jgi:hypothetical protein
MNKMKDVIKRMMETIAKVEVKMNFSGAWTPVSLNGGSTSTCLKNKDKITHEIKEINTIGVKIKGRKWTSIKFSK